MSEDKVIDELEAELARHEQRLRDNERIEETLLQDIPLVGFRTGVEEVRLRRKRKCFPKWFTRIGNYLRWHQAVGTSRKTHEEDVSITVRMFQVRGLRMEAKIRNILFPVDFSTRSVLAAQHVKTWLDRFGATLNTLHVVDANALGHDAEGNDEFLYSDVSNLISKRSADLKYFSDHYFGENVARHTVLSGGTADQIEDFAKRENIDLIMLPRNHQNLVSRALEDSLAAKLLERCTASVWVTEHLYDISPSAFHSILCAVHFENDVTLDAQDHRMLQTVRELATTFQATVTFLFVISGAVEESSGSVTPIQAVAGMEPFVVQVQGLFGSSAEILRKPGKVITTITDTAQQMAAGLIVVGWTRPGTIGLGVQINILKIDHAARCAVLSV